MYIFVAPFTNRTQRKRERGGEIDRQTDREREREIKTENTSIKTFSLVPYIS